MTQLNFGTGAAPQDNPYLQIGGMGYDSSMYGNSYMGGGTYGMNAGANDPYGVYGQSAGANNPYQNPYMNIAGMGATPPQYGGTYQPPPQYGQTYQPNPYLQISGMGAAPTSPQYGQTYGGQPPPGPVYGQTYGGQLPPVVTSPGLATDYSQDPNALNAQDGSGNDEFIKTVDPLTQGQSVINANYTGLNTGSVENVEDMYMRTQGVAPVVDKSFMDFGGFVNENPEIFSGLTPGQVSALKNAYGDGTNGMANVMGMFQDPAFQGLAAPSGPDLSGLQQDTTVWGDWNYDGPQDVYAFEQGVADSNLMRLDNGASWVYKDRNGNVVGEISKTMNAADRMANAGVDTASIEEMMRRTIGNYNANRDSSNQALIDDYQRRIEDEYMRTQGDTSQLVVDPVIPANPVVDPVIDNEAPLPEPQETDTVLQYQSPVLPGLAQLPGQREALWSMMTGETSVPYLDKILAGSRERQSKEMDYMKAGLSNRGVLNSTPGMRELSDLGIRHDAGNAQAALQALGMVAPQMQGAINSTYEQDMGIDKNAYQQWSDTTRLQSDLDWRRDQSKNQSLQLLLQAISGGGGSVPGYNVPGAEPGFLSNIFQTWGNAGFPMP